MFMHRICLGLMAHSLVSGVCVGVCVHMLFALACGVCVHTTPPVFYQGFAHHPSCVHGVCALCVHGVSALCVHGVSALCVHG